jgi:hypothetical protein
LSIKAGPEDARIAVRDRPEPEEPFDWTPYMATGEPQVAARSPPATALASFYATGELANIHKHLLEDGIEFHTVIPISDGAMFTWSIQMGV